MKPFHRRLVPSTALLAVALVSAEAHAVTDNFCSFPTQLTTWTLNGNAFEALNSEIRLTDVNVADEASSAFDTTPIALTATTTLHAYFQFQMGPSATGGEGVAFVLQNSAAGAAALGGVALKMGYSGITPSVEVVFGTVVNTAGTAPANSVSVVLNGSTTANVKTALAGFTMAGAGPLSAWVDYTPTGTLLSVYLAKTATPTKPATPVLTYAGSNLFTLLGPQTFVGFASATGASPQLNEHDVYQLEVSTSGVPCGCEGDSACSGATPACDAVGVCAVCSATNGTACTGATPVCDVPTNSCVGCLTDANCSGAKPICDAMTLTCRACSSNADCSTPTPECATSGVNSGECVLCVADANCPAGSPKCTTANTCVQCVSAANCGGDTPICTGGACVACGSDADCTSTPTTPACEVWGACGQCSQTNGTACSGASDVCDFPTGTCVDCEFNSDCAGMTPTCDTTTHTCVPCQTNADCEGNPGGSACVTTGMKAGSCVICAVDSDCTSPAAPKCDTTANECVACLTSADCSAPTPECSPANICVGCLTSADCAGATPVCDTASSQCKACENDFSATNPGPLSCPNAALGACQPAGTGLAGQCALCSSVDKSACATVPTTPVCIPAVATCGCAADTDCASDTYCDMSTTSTGVCTAGCRTVGDAGVDNCSTGKYCTETNGTVGTCMGQPCNSNTDCKTPDPVCNTIVQPHACVVCLNDPDCPKGDVCDSTNKCVECTPKQTTSCSATGVGSACLANETCGCATDTSCGGPTSGRVCNTTTQACEPGCRGSGGNGCAAPETCSSTSSSIGECKGAVTKDAGAPAFDAGVDSGATPDASAARQVVSDAAGCGCRLATSKNDNPRAGAIFGLLLGLSLVVRRRRNGQGTES